MSEAARKTLLRRERRAEAERHSAEERLKASEKLCAMLKQQDVWKKSRSVLFYSPIGHEPNIWGLVTEALAMNKTVGLPRFETSQSSYSICRVRNHLEDLVPGQFGIPEPNPACSLLDLNLLDLILVPGVGFATAGQRLGRGKGYYDRLLANAGGFKCGVAFDWQVVADLPLEPHDVPLNCIVTPTRWLEVPPPRRF
ncbi:MAG TPA: 5-formyltetrahydrofolate cyclo-ligase [Candidatus Saccharimonadales bacterium]|nr:5-formyltetrahydrofolate cyclo-ligase [Candidatus Saccharimonadales bacterium]